MSGDIDCYHIDVDSAVVVQRRSSGVSQDVEVEWTAGKGKHRNVNAVAPLEGGGGAAEVCYEQSVAHAEVETGPVSITPAGKPARRSGRHVSLPDLVCEPVAAEVGLPV